MNEKLRSQHADFLHQIEQHRLLPHVKGFTNAWNSQSTAEGTNSAVNGLVVGVNQPLPIVMDKIVSYMERLDVTREPKITQKLDAGQLRLFSELYTVVSKKCLKELLAQYGRINFYDVKQESEIKFNVTAIRYPEKAPRVVTKNDRGTWICDDNMHIYKGFTCRHTMAVLVRLNQALSKFDVNSRWWKSHLQPTVELVRESPFKTRNMQSVLNAAAVRNMEGPIPMSIKKPRLSTHDEDEIDDDNVGENGETIGWNSGSESENGSDAHLYYLHGAPLAIPLKPKELQNQIRSQAHTLVTQIGTSVDKLLSFSEIMKSWAHQNMDIQHASMPLQSVSNRGSHIGAPTDTVGLKSPKVKQRGNGVRVKKPYACSVCGRTGHTRATCSNKPKGNEKDKANDDQL